MGPFTKPNRPLKTWILGFGGMARVVTPAALAREILDEAELMRQLYAPAPPFDSLRPLRPGRLDSMKLTLRRERRDAIIAGWSADRAG